MRRCARGRRPIRSQEQHPPLMAVGFVLEFRAARSGGGPKAQRAGPTVRRNARTRPFYKIRPRARPPAPAYGVRCAPRTAIPLGIALLALQAVDAYGVWGRGWQQKTLCVPPLREASARATLRVAGARPKAPPNSFGFGPRAPGVGQRPSAQARRFYEPQRHDQQLGPARRGPKNSPVLRPVSASLRLRFRSATCRRPLGFHLDFAHRKMSEIPL